MKKGILRALSVGFVLLIIGCYNEPQSVERIGKDYKFQVEFLFEKDGVKVYRFEDGGRQHYFTTKGDTMTEQSTGESTYEERIKSN